MRYRLSDAAARDVRRLYRQSILDFGLGQANRYYDGLIATFEMLARNPEAGRDRPDLRGHVRTYPFEAHVIAYKKQAAGLVIVRVMHSRQDIPRRL